MRTYVYKHFDKKGTLLYVGIADDVQKRTAQHLKRSPWAASIASTTSKPYGTRIKAAIAELQAIDREKPLYNVIPGRERRRKIEHPVMMTTRVPAQLLKRVVAACETKKIRRSVFVRQALENMLTDA